MLEVHGLSHAYGRHQALDEVVLGHLLAMHEVFHQLVAGKQLLHLAHVAVELLLCSGGFVVLAHL